ncbi:hypothetical protein [Paraflavitalea speifideaquila]|nr:hypothetical protein [Paraflavitalea speifideiaquila]
MDHEEEIKQLISKAFTNQELYRPYYAVAEVKTFKRGVVYLIG